MAQDVKINEYNLYDKLDTNSWEFADEDWSSNDDVEFANPNKFEEEFDGQLHTTKKNLLKSCKEEKTYEPIEKETPAENGENDSDWASSSVPDQMNFFNDEPSPSTRRLQRNSAPRILYPGHIPGRLHIAQDFYTKLQILKPSLLHLSKNPLILSAHI